MHNYPKAFRVHPIFLLLNSIFSSKTNFIILLARLFFSQRTNYIHFLVFVSLKVSELLETGKTMFNNLSTQFEERLISWVTWCMVSFYQVKMYFWSSRINRFFFPSNLPAHRIHRDQVEKWHEEIKELRLLDASNEAARALLQNAQFHLFQSVTEENSWGKDTNQNHMLLALMQFFQSIAHIALAFSITQVQLQEPHIIWLCL